MEGISPRIPDIYEILANIKKTNGGSDTSGEIARVLNHGISTQPPSDLVGDMRRPPETITGKILNANA